MVVKLLRGVGTASAALGRASASLGLVANLRTVWAVRVLLLELVDAGNDFTVILQVLPEGNLVAVDDHLVGWVVDLLTAELHE